MMDGWYLAESRPSYFKGRLLSIVNVWRHPDGRERRVRLDGRDLRYVQEVTK